MNAAVPAGTWKPRDGAVLFMGVVMLALGLFARAGVPMRDGAAPLSAPPLEDDSFYTQSYARSVLRGEFFRINGVHRGDAYFPAFVLLSAALQKAADGPVAGLRSVLVLNAVLAAASAAAAGLLAHRMLRDFGAPRRLAWSAFAAGAYACNSILFLVDMNAMESGLVLLLFLAVALRTLAIAGLPAPRDRDFLGLGALLALLCLTRVDMALFTLFYGLSSFAVFGRTLTARRFFLAYAPAAAATAAWLAFGYAGTGSLIPTGGAAFFDASAGPLGRNLLKSGAMFFHFVIGLPYETWYVPIGWIDLSSRHALLPAAAALSVVLAGLVLARSPEKGRLRAPFRALAPCAAGLAGMALPYLYGYTAPFFFQRYFAPVEALIVVAWACVLCATVGGAGAGRAARAFAVFLWAAYVSVFTVHQRWIADVPYCNSWPAYEAAKAAQGRGQSVASFETGVLGYYLPDVINLDGKTNVDAIREIRKKDGSIARYVVAQAPDYVVDRWGALLEDGWAGNPAVAKDPSFLESYEFVHARPYLWRRKK